MHELPPDPDWDDVPPELAALHGRKATLVGWDWDEDDIYRADGVVVVVPEFFAAARRARGDAEHAGA